MIDGLVRSVAELARRARDFDPSQSRWPAGAPEGLGGQWMDARDALASLQTAETIGQVNAAAMAGARRITGVDIPFDMRGSDVAVARELVEGVLRGLSRYPRTRIAHVGTYGPGASVLTPAGASVFSLTANAFTKTDGQTAEIYFNNLFAVDPSNYSYDRLATHFGVVHPSATGIGAHEVGHAVAEQSGAARPSPEVTEMISDAAEKDGVSPSEYLASAVSPLAATGDEEFVAETVADVVMNGKDASAVSRKVVSGIDAKYRWVVGE